MKTLSIVLLAFSLSLGNLIAQEISGIATYKTNRKVDLKMDGDGVTEAMQEQIQAQLRKQFQKEYTLTFTKDESIYKEVEGLNTPDPLASSGGMQITISGGNENFYRNIKENRYVDETEIMSKPFLVKDTLEKPEWELTKESKNIGNYTCFKATYSREVEEETFDSATDSIVKIKKQRVTNAWYTLDIPLQHGPGRHWGLPGLILEVTDGDMTILCSKIVLNPEKEIVIEEPSKGKEVTQEAFNEIQEKKSQEMMERFQSDSRRGDGNSFKIRIGG
ncbi:GLPGLI family protein [Patiriisocius hiemis]|uniref:GLPGLI family protein n=1 Tax=Patiriisocius hiemis TaxID=3075604 RepID=A0ABU2YCX8_9FLAO|nr:GLPGLI family protein [Constantimarinum sp. W242]MDT0555867.1 GLPGLI family protein [Constantimarinum sp. W242]